MKIKCICLTKELENLSLHIADLSVKRGIITEENKKSFKKLILIHDQSV
jgi:hypothetical protein